MNKRRRNSGMIKHLFAIIWNQRKSNSWILAELFLASICLWFAVDYTLILINILNRPLGFEAAYTYRIDLAERTPDSDGYVDATTKTTTTGEDVFVIMERIRQHSDVEAVSLSFCAEPYAATHYTSTVRYSQLYFNDTIGITAQELRVTPSFFKVFRNRGKDMVANEVLEASLNAQTVILAENTVERLMSGEAPVGKIIKVGNKNESKTVGAISTPVRWTEYFKSYPTFFTLLSETEIKTGIHSDNLSGYELCVRVQPDKIKEFEERFMVEMLEQTGIGNIYLMDVRPSSVIRKAVVAPEESNIMLSSLLFFFIIINIFLGVSGTFVFRTRHRRGEIGLRMAMGSSRKQLGGLLVAEGLLLLTLAFLPALVVDLNIGIAGLVNVNWVDFTPVRFWGGAITTYLIMAVMIVAGIGYPAYRAMQIKPAEALKDDD